MKILSIAIIEDNNQVLMRKKPINSLPYKETWYLFGGEVTAEINPEQAAINIVKTQTGINIELFKILNWDTEIKPDLDGEIKQFIYLNAIYNYVSGNLEIGKNQNIELIKWIPIKELHNYDIVPPAKKLLQEYNYL